MSNKFFYLYLTGGTLALLMLIYRLVAGHSSWNDTWITINAVAVILLYYMAYKVRREKEDKDLM
jgi:hypothetical protein